GWLKRAKKYSAKTLFPPPNSYALKTNLNKIKKEYSKLKKEHYANKKNWNRFRKWLGEKFDNNTSYSKPKEDIKLKEDSLPINTYIKTTGNLFYDGKIILMTWVHFFLELVGYVILISFTGKALYEMVHLIFSEKNHFIPELIGH